MFSYHLIFVLSIHLLEYIFSRALLKAQAMSIMIARVTIKRLANKKPNNIQEKPFETQFSFPDN